MDLSSVTGACHDKLICSGEMLVATSLVGASGMSFASSTYELSNDVRSTE